MVSIKIKKGIHLNVSGRPSKKLEAAPPPAYVAAIPEFIPMIKPKPAVDVGDAVQIGSVLFTDKKRPELQFLSPGGGKVVAVNYGPRRVIREIVIELAAREKTKKFPSFSTAELNKAKKDKIARVLMAGGVWPFIKALPLREIASPDDPPNSIWVGLEGKDPFQPMPQVYLNKQKTLFSFGIKILKKFCPHVYVIAPRENAYLHDNFKEFISHTVEGEYPADDPGVILYHHKQSPDENHAWYIHGQDLLSLAKMLKTGTYPVERIVAVSGLSGRKSRHLNTRIGVKIGTLVPEVTDMIGVRCVTGGVFDGRLTRKDSYLGFYETSVNIVPEMTEKDFFGFLKPGFHRPGYSRAFLSVFNTSPFELDSGLHGQERACINCGNCAEVCAVDILPQFMYKSLMAEEIEEALSHGLLDCVECGLCSYVCPSKIELTAVFVEERRRYYKEKLSHEFTS